MCPKNPLKRSVNRRFQAKVAKYYNLHIMETTASIPTRFCTVIKTTKCPSRVVQSPTQQIQDGGRPPSWKNRISPQRFDRFRPNLARRHSSTLLSHPTVTNLKFWKSKMAAAAILKNLKIAISRPRLDRFRWNLAWWRSFALLSVPTVKISNI